MYVRNFSELSTSLSSLSWINYISYSAGWTAQRSVGEVTFTSLFIFFSAGRTVRIHPQHTPTHVGEVVIPCVSIRINQIPS